MTFSIVIPTYNGEIFLANAIESALSQTRPADEIIVADDNSSDSTIDIASRYADRVRVCRHEGPSGFVNGWNKAIAYAKCDFIAILHQDDLLHPDFLKEAERVLTFSPVATMWTVTEKSSERQFRPTAPCDDSRGVSTLMPTCHMATRTSIAARE